MSISMILSDTFTHYESMSEDSSSYVLASGFNSDDFIDYYGSREGKIISCNMTTIASMFSRLDEIFGMFVHLIETYNTSFNNGSDLAQKAMGNSKFRSVLDKLMVHGIARSDGMMSSSNWFDMLCEMISEVSNGVFIVEQTKHPHGSRMIRRIKYNQEFVFAFSHEDALRIFRKVTEQLTYLVGVSWEIYELVEAALFYFNK